MRDMAWQKILESWNATETKTGEKITSIMASLKLQGSNSTVRLQDKDESILTIWRFTPSR